MAVKMHPANGERVHVFAKRVTPVQLTRARPMPPLTATKRSTCPAKKNAWVQLISQSTKHEAPRSETRIPPYNAGVSASV